MHWQNIAALIEAPTLLAEYRCCAFVCDPTEEEALAAESVLLEGHRLRRIEMMPWEMLRQWCHEQARRLATRHFNH